MRGSVNPEPKGFDMRNGKPISHAGVEGVQRADLRIRGLGLGSIGLSLMAGIWLHRLFHNGYPPDPTMGQYALALITFVAASLGSGLLVLGRHVHDSIQVAERRNRH
jgi:hypothetical protein